ncbi:MAG: hypothetical protein ACR2HM_07305 [Acidimicrobiales bacterium]
MPRTRKLWAAAAVALLVMAGCSRGDDNDDAASNTTTPAAAGPTTTARPVDTSFTGQGSAQFCALSRTFNERFGSVSASPTAAQLRTLTREGQAAITEAVTKAPAEIKADVQVIAATYNGLVAELEKVNFEATRLPPAALGALSAPEFTRATTRFQTYTRTVCGTG